MKRALTRWMCSILAASIIGALPLRSAHADGLVIIDNPPATVAAQGFFATQLDGSGTRLVFATDGSVRTIIQEGIFSEGVRMELPWGWVAVSLEEGTPDGRYVTTPAAVRLADGGWVPLTLPQIYPIGGATD